MTMRKRLVATVLVADGWIVNAYGFGRFLPVGRPRFIVEELERWEVDEICVLDVSEASTSETHAAHWTDTLKEFAGQTPVSFGGGIHSTYEARAVVAGGAERVVLGGAAFQDPDLAGRVADDLGEQAVVVSAPFRIESGNAYWYMPRGGKRRDLRYLRDSLGEHFRGEVLLQSMATDGHDASVQPTLFSDALEVLAPLRCMVMGGIKSVDTAAHLLAHEGVTAVCVGNLMHARELLSPRWKATLGSSLRPYGRRSVTP